MTDNLSIYRTLYRNLAREAIDAGFVSSIGEFTRLAEREAPRGMLAAARRRDVEAVVEFVDAAERALDRLLEERADREADSVVLVDPTDDPESYYADGEWDEAEAYRQAVWRRACDAQLDYRA